jgi:hypothetical protein
VSGTTSRFAFPYPTQTDPLKEGAAKIKAFAEGADSVILNRSYGKSIIATEQKRETAAFGTLVTPDQVEVVMPENGMIVVAYHATWLETASNAARAAIFIGSNQLQGSDGGGAFGPQETFIGGEIPNRFRILTSFAGGLISAPPGSAYTGDVTTGQVIGASNTNGGFRIAATTNTNFPYSGGPCYIFATAGTYTVSIQFRVAGGHVAVKNRKLWVWSIF